MLVVDPAKRISMAQIRQHRWMQADPSLLPPACPAFSLLSYNSSLGDYDEQALAIMQALGVDRQRTVEVSPPAALPGRAPLPGVVGWASRCWPAELKREPG